MLKVFRVIILIPVFCAPFHLFSQLNLEQIGHLSYAPASLAGCKAYVDSTGREWALVGTSTGVSIVDLQDPTQPVQRFSVPGLPSNWRELRSWNGFAYAGSEADSSGITIIDLRHLPDTIYWKTWFGDGAYENKVRRSHAVQTANGYLFIFGGGNVTNGATIADLSNPWNPHIVGKYTLNYVHDGFIRGDTLWTSEIYQGQFGVVDISDIKDPQLITTNPTPGKFNHNTGLSGDSKTLFTTDEKQNAPLSSFDVSDLDNITLLDTYFPSQKPAFEVHNVRVIGDFLVNPSYGGQLTIVDASRPDNLIETAWAVVGTSLVWDADPYLPSGIIFATAKNEGLFVFQPSYQHAAWLEGIVTDSISGLPLIGAKVFVTGTPNADTSKINGAYKTGAAAQGSYTVDVIKPGYNPKSIQNVVLQNGVVTTLNIQLSQAVTGTTSPDGGSTITVSPTLFSDHLRVGVSPESAFRRGETIVRLIDLSGKVLRENRTAAWPFLLQNLQQLAPGPYILSLENGANRIAVHLTK